jgi:hypothetical protein
MFVSLVQNMAAIVSISYEDLVSFDPSCGSPVGAKVLMERVGEAFGPQGLGILAIGNVPEFPQLRRALLPLAAKLSTIPDLDSCIVESSMYSIGWSHGKETLASGKRDMWKGSFYVNPFVDTDDDNNNNNNTTTTTNVWPEESLPQLKPAVLEMAKLLHRVGCLLAKVCDAYCYQPSQGEKTTPPSTSIEQAIQASRDTKARLLHYFAAPSPDDAVSGDSWCAWHNDHVRETACTW